MSAARPCRSPADVRKARVRRPVGRQAHRVDAGEVERGNALRRDPARQRLIGNRVVSPASVAPAGDCPIGDGLRPVPTSVPDDPAFIAPAGSLVGRGDGLPAAPSVYWRAAAILLPRLFRKPSTRIALSLSSGRASSGPGGASRCNSARLSGTMIPVVQRLKPRSSIGLRPAGRAERVRLAGPE